jgi:hypothetical protein
MAHLFLEPISFAPGDLYSPVVEALARVPRASVEFHHPRCVTHGFDQPMLGSQADHNVGKENGADGCHCGQPAVEGDDGRGVWSCACAHCAVDSQRENKELERWASAAVDGPKICLDCLLMRRQLAERRLQPILRNSVQ